LDYPEKRLKTAKTERQDKNKDKKEINEIM